MLYFILHTLIFSDRMSVEHLTLLEQGHVKGTQGQTERTPNSQIQKNQGNNIDDEMIMIILVLDHVAAQTLSHIQLFVTPWTASCQDSLSFSISWSLFKLMSVESMMPSNHLVLFSFCFQSFPASGSFSADSSSHEVAESIGV